jgi:hypothetical protein
MGTPGMGPFRTFLGFRASDRTGCPRLWVRARGLRLGGIANRRWSMAKRGGCDVFWPPMGGLGSARPECCQRRPPSDASGKSGFGAF